VIPLPVFLRLAELAQVDDDLKSMVWSHPRARSYYRNSKGRVYMSCPYRLVDMWTLLREPKPEDYAFHFAGDNKAGAG
jgi:hypothetical protein